MEISRSLLVAMMFVVILSIGIGTILSSLAGIINRRMWTKFDRIHLQWLFLILLAHFNLFWHTVDILSVDDWGFAGFLYIITGPILIFFATNVLVPDDARLQSGDVDNLYFDVSPQFFRLLAAMQVWVLGGDLLMGTGMTIPGWVNVGIAVVAIFLSFNRERATHAAMTIVMWGIFVAVITLRGLGVFDF